MSSGSSPQSMNGLSESERNAKARNAVIQARHRAKRKAYVANLEQSVQNLRANLKKATTDQLIQQLEAENQRLTAELLCLQAQLASGGSDDGSLGWPFDDDELIDTRPYGLQGWSPN